MLCNRMLRNAEPHRPTPTRNRHLNALVALSGLRAANHPGQIRFQRRAPSAPLERPAASCRALAAVPHGRLTTVKTISASASRLHAARNDHPRICRRLRSRLAALPCQRRSATAPHNSTAGNSCGGTDANSNNHIAIYGYRLPVRPGQLRQQSSPQDAPAEPQSPRIQWATNPGSERPTRALKQPTNISLPGARPIEMAPRLGHKVLTPLRQCSRSAWKTRPSCSSLLRYISEPPALHFERKVTTRIACGLCLSRPLALYAINEPLYANESPAPTIARAHVAATRAKAAQQPI